MMNRVERQLDRENRDYRYNNNLRRRFDPSQTQYPFPDLRPYVYENDDNYQYPVIRNKNIYDTVLIVAIITLFTVGYLFTIYYSDAEPLSNLEKDQLERIEKIDLELQALKEKSQFLEKGSKIYLDTAFVDSLKTEIDSLNSKLKKLENKNKELLKSIIENREREK